MAAPKPRWYSATMRSRTLPILTLALGLLGACAHAPARPSADEDRAVLKAKSDAWDKAIIDKDEAAIAGNMAEDFRQIDGGGNLETKASFVAGLVEPELTIDPYGVDEFEIRLYGDVALLSGKTDMTGSYKGERFESHYRYIDVYVRRDGDWKVVSVQITRLPPPKPADG